MHTNKFGYIDAMPGAGKTAFFIDKAVSLLNKKDPSDILLYAAPTVNLLKETLARIETHANFRAAFRSRIFLVSTYRPSIEKRCLHFNTRPISTINYIFGLIDESKLLREIDVPSRVVRAGDVVLTTHESFLQVQNDPSNFQLLRKVTVIFDEARHCVMAQYNLKGLRNSDFGHMKDLFELDSVASRQNKLASDLVGRWKVFRIKSAPSKAALAEVYAKTNDYVPNAMSLIRRVICDYSASGRASVYVLVENNLDIVLKGPTEMAAANMFSILRPTNLFDGYKRVILTSAFFTDSQMYHFLRVDGHEFVDLLATSKDVAIRKIRPC